MIHNAKNNSNHKLHKWIKKETSGHKSATHMCLPIFNLPVCVRKCLDSITVSPRFHMASHVVKLEGKIHIPLIIDDFIEVCMCQKREGLWAIANLGCNTPRALYVSFQALFDILQNELGFCLWEWWWSSKMLTTIDRSCRLDSTPWCTHCNWRCSCKPEHIH
jgi:hypothetical protein